MFKLAESMDDFFNEVYTSAHGGETTVSEFKANPSKIASTFKDFIFHDPAYGKLNVNVQNAIQACITTVCNRF
jgi:hypothetical protein